MTDSKNLLLKLVQASSENEVERIINNNPILSSPKNWRHYGSSNNIGTVTGQSPEAVPSLVEKILNSIDAMLIKQCWEYGDDPKAKSSANSMEEALEKYFNLDEEKYASLSNAERRKLASNIQIIAEGDKKMPNVIIYDNGEGQHPQDFPDTLVSLSRNNKQSIFFVQGKYNMGGTAVLPFCGNKRYQLIVSKKNIKTSCDGKYGFTLIRRNRGNKDMHVKTSWYEYCTTVDGRIFEFDSEPLDLGLFRRKFDGGTFIKLYNYDLPRSSYITFDLWRDLNRYVYKSALPILLYEKRPFSGLSEKNESKVMHGNRARCFLDNRESVEKAIAMTIESDNVKYPVEVFCFKKDVVPQEFVANMPVVFTVNGQVQHKLDNYFITQKAKKAYLKNYLLINVDCTNMPQELHEDIFMSSRSQMRDSEEYRNLESSIAKEIRDNRTLTEIDEQRRRDKIFQNPKDEKFLKNVMSKLLKDDKEIEKLLGLKSGVFGSSLKKIKKQIEKEGASFSGKSYPTVFKFKNLKPGSTKMLPQNGECKIEIETDTENEYLIRPYDKGEIKIRVRKPHVRSGEGHIKPNSEDEEELSVNVVGPDEGNIKLRIKPKKEIPVGSTFSIDIEMSSPNGTHLLTAEVKIDNPQTKKDKSELPVKQEHSLPSLIHVYKELSEDEDEKKGAKDWSELDWDENDVCSIQESSGENSLIDAVYVNMDSKELHNYIRSRKINGKNIAHVTRSYKTSVYLMTLVFYHELSQRLKRQEADTTDKYGLKGVQYDAVEMVSYIMKGLARILLHITTNESLIKEMENDE